MDTANISILKLGNKEYHIRKDPDRNSGTSTYEINTYTVNQNEKTLEIVSHITEEQYKMFYGMFELDKTYKSLIDQNNSLRERIKELEEALKESKGILEYSKCALEKWDIIACSECKKYSRDPDICDMCDIRSCGCVKITRVDTWNLSGMNMCEKCLPKYCHFCISQIDREESEKNNGYCDNCEERFRNE